MKRHELTESEWERIQGLLPAERGRVGRPPKISNRTMMNAILFIAKTGLPWRDLPERYGKWSSIHDRFCTWNRRGVLQRVLDALAQEADHEFNMADGSYIKAHQDAAGGKGGPRASILDALGEVLPPKSTLLWTVSAIPCTSISAQETNTT